MQGSEACQKPTADIGGWLADYCNTAFLALSGQARANVIYAVVENALYRSLAELIGPIGLSAGKTGNVWEQLCWHAYEHDKGAFILAVIWNTSNRQLMSHPATSQGNRNAAQDVPSARNMPPPPPPQGPAVSQGMPPPQGPPSLTTITAANLRMMNRPTGLHNAMRNHLQTVASQSPLSPAVRRCPCFLPCSCHVFAITFSPNCCSELTVLKCVHI